MRSRSSEHPAGTGLTIYGGGGNDVITINGIGGPTTIVGGGGNDVINVETPTNTLAGVLGRLTVDGDNSLQTRIDDVRDDEPLVAQFLDPNRKIVIVKTGPELTTSDGRKYYQAMIVPILTDADAGSHFGVYARTVVLDSGGAIVEKLVQEKGVAETGKWKTDDGTATGAPLYFNSEGEEVTAAQPNTGVPVIVAADSSQGGPVRTVYVDAAFNKVFDQYGPNLVTNPSFSDFVATNGTSGGWTSANTDGNGGWRATGFWFFFNGYWILNSNGAGGSDPTLTQTLHGLNVGMTYQVTGQYQNVWPQYGSSTAFSFGVFVNGSLRFQARKQDAPAGSWQSFTTTFTATSDTATLMFAGERNGDDSSWQIDNISVRSVNPASFVTNFVTGTNLWIDNSGHKTNVDPGTNRPSLIPINDTQQTRFVRVSDHIVAAGAGNDTLNIVSSGVAADLTATLDTYRVPVSQLTDGVPVLHGAGLASYFTHPDQEFYFGGEPVLDPFTGAPLLYTTEADVRDLFTGAVLRDPFGVALKHAIGDPMLHIAGEPVYHVNGDYQTYIGGEQVRDEDGNLVFTGSTPFLHAPDQVQIHDRLDRVYDLVDKLGAKVAEGTRTYDPAQFTVSALTAGTSFDLGSLAGFAYHLGAGDLVSVTVYDGTKIFNLAPGDFSVAGDVVTLLNTVATGSASVVVKTVVATPAVHAAGDPKYYVGSDSAAAQAAIGRSGLLQIGDAVVDVSGQLVIDGNGAVVLHTAETIGTNRTEENTFRRTGAPSQSFTLQSVPNGFAKVLLDGVELPASAYTISGNVVTVTPSSRPATDVKVTVVYRLEVKLHARGEPVYQLASGQWVQATYTGTDPKYFLGNEPRIFRGGEPAYYSTADPVSDSTLRYRLDVAGPSGAGMPGEILYFGLEHVNITLGPGNDLVTVVTTQPGGVTTIETGAGTDRVAVRATQGPAMISTSGGDDTVYVGSQAGLWHTNAVPAVQADANGDKFLNVQGNGNLIGASLGIDGGTGFDLVTVDDTTDTGNNTGSLSSSQLGGIFGGGTINYGNLEQLDISLGNAVSGNTFTIHSTHGSASLVATTSLTIGSGADVVKIETIAGPTTVSTGSGNDVIKVGSTVGSASDPIPGSTLDGILNALAHARPRQRHRRAAGVGQRRADAQRRHADRPRPDRPRDDARDRLPERRGDRPVAQQRRGQLLRRHDAGRDDRHDRRRRRGRAPEPVHRRDQHPLDRGPDLDLRRSGQRHHAGQLRPRRQPDVRKRDRRDPEPERRGGRRPLRDRPLGHRLADRAADADQRRRHVAAGRHRRQPAADLRHERPGLLPPAREPRHRHGHGGRLPGRREPDAGRGRLLRARRLRRRHQRRRADLRARRRRHLRARRQPRADDDLRRRRRRHVPGRPGVRLAARRLEPGQRARPDGLLRDDADHARLPQQRHQPGHHASSAASATTRSTSTTTSPSSSSSARRTTTRSASAPSSRSTRTTRRRRSPTSTAARAPTSSPTPSTRRCGSTAATASTPSSWSAPSSATTSWSPTRASSAPASSSPTPASSRSSSTRRRATTASTSRARART